MRIVALVLAAGRGERLGGPKALLGWPPGAEGPLPLAIAHVAARSECARVLVVTRADTAEVLLRRAPELLGGGDRGELLVSRSPDDQGPAGSIAAVAQELANRGETYDAAIITPVDCPPVGVDTVAGLLGALGDGGVMAARPRHGGRRGHPVVLRWSLLERYLVIDPPPLRDLLRELGAACCDVDTADADVVLDIDTPAQWRFWCREHGADATAGPTFLL